MANDIPRPTIETVLERITALGQNLDERINSLEKKFDERISAFERKVDERFSHVDERLGHLDSEIDRVASVFYSTKSEVLALSADFKVLRTQLKEVLPVPQAS